MDDKSKHTITSKQLIWTVISSMVGVGILSLPRVAAEHAQQNGWLAVLLGAGFPFLGILLIYAVVSRYPSLTLAEYSEKILGRFLGKMLAFIYAGYAILLAGSILNTLSFTLATIALPRTPLWVINWAVLLVSVNFARQGFKIIGRLNELFFYLLLPLLLMLFPVLGEIQMSHLLPLTGVPLKDILQGIQNTVFAYLGFEILLVIFPFLQKKEEFFHGAFLGLGITIATYFYVTFLAIAFYGPGAIAKIVWPTVSLLNAVEVPVVERLEFFFIFLWSLVAFRTVGLQIFASGYTISRVFKLADHGIVVILLTPVIYFIAQYPKNLVQSFLFEVPISLLGGAIALGFPLLLLGVSLILGKKEEKKKSA